MLSTCNGCGVVVEPSKNPGNPRKWCSNRCRKASYGDSCVDCGSRTVYGSEKARVPEPRCDDCRVRTRSDRRCARVMKMYKLRIQGLGNTEISRRLDYPATSIRAEMMRLRSLGFRMPQCGRRHPLRQGELVVTQEAKTLGRELARRGITPDTVLKAAM